MTSADDFGTTGASGPAAPGSDQWATPASGAWDDQANWTGGVPGPTSTAILGGSGSYTVDAAGNDVAGALDGTDPDAALDITGTLELGTGGIMAGTLSEAADGTLDILAGSLDLTGSGTLDGVVTGAGELAVETGTLTLGSGVAMDLATLAIGTGYMSRWRPT